MRRVLGLLKGHPLVSFALSAVAVLIVWFAVTNWLDDLTAWWPWSDESKLERAETRAETATSNASARTLEVEGEREQAQRIDTYHRQVIEVRDFTARAETEARSATDAEEPLAAGLADSLGEHQRRLCLASPGVCRAAAPGPPNGSDHAL